MAVTLGCWCWLKSVIEKMEMKWLVLGVVLFWLKSVMAKHGDEMAGALGDMVLVVGYYRKEMQMKWLVLWIMVLV